MNQIYCFNRRFLVFGVMVLIELTVCGQQHSFIHLQQNKLVDAEAKEIKMNAVNLGGWLLWEGWIWGGGFTRETDMKERLHSLLGKEEFQKFIQSYYANYITEKDIALIAANGFNTVRLPFNHFLFDPGSYINGYTILDSLFQWCRKYHVYVVLDMHAAPGGQSSFFIADAEKPYLWQSGQNKEKTIALWKAIATKYQDEPMIAGYDLLNEPDFETRQLISLYSDIIKAIRTADNNHLIIVEGNKLAKNFKDFPASFDDNQIYSFHFYSWFNEKNKTKNLNELLKEIPGNKPVWCGEWGEDTFGNLAEIKKLMVQNTTVCGTAFWTWKRVYMHNNRLPACTVYLSEEWKEIISWLTWKLFKPSKQVTKKGINAFLNNILLDNCTVNKNLIKFVNK